MAFNLLGLGMVFRAQDLASGIIRRLERNMNELDSTARRVGMGLAVGFAGHQLMDAGFAAAKGLGAMITNAGDLEYKLHQLKAQTQGAGADFMGLAKATAFKVGLTTRVSVSDAVVGMQELAKAGLQANDVFAFLPHSINLVTAAAGELNLGDAAKMFTQVKAAFGPGAGSHRPEASEIANVIAKAAMESVSGVGEVSKWVTRALRGTAKFQQEYSDTIAFMSKIRDQIGSPEIMSTSVGNVMQKLSLATKAAEYERVTGVLLQDSKGKTKALATIIAETEQSPMWRQLGKVRGAQSEFLTKLFGERNVTAFTAFQTYLKQGEFDEKTGKWLRGMELANHLLKDFAQAAKGDYINRFLIAETQSVGGLLTLIQNKWQSIMTIIGDAFLPVVKPIATWLNDLLHDFGTWIAGLSPEWKKFLVVASLVGIGLSIAGGAAMVLFGLFTAFVASIGIVGPVLLAMVKPFLIMLSVFGALVPVGAALFVGWRKNIGGMRDGVGGFIEKTKLAFQVLGQLFSRGGTWGDVDKRITSPENSGLFNFLMKVWMFIGRIRNFFRNVWTGFEEAIMKMDGPLRIIMEQFKKFLGFFSGSVGTAEENRKAFQDWGEAGKVVGKIFAVIANVMIILAAVIFETLITVVGFIGKLDDFAAKTESLFNTVKGVNALREGRYKDAAEHFFGGTSASDIAEGASRMLLPGHTEKAIDWMADKAVGNPFAQPAGSTEGPQSSLTNPAMPAVAALSASRGASNVNVASPVINYTPPPQTFVLKVNDETLMTAVTRAVERDKLRSYQVG